MNIAIQGARGKLGTLIHNLEPTASLIERTGEIPQADIIIDVSSAQGTKTLLSRAQGIPLLIGTTGELPWDELEAYAKTAPVAVVPNFSVGIPLLLSLLEVAIPALPEGWDIEVIEAHHNQKKDAPSGTADRLGCYSSPARSRTTDAVGRLCGADGAGTQRRAPDFQLATRLR